MWYIRALIILTMVGLLDGHISTIVALFLIYVLGWWSVNTIKNKIERVNGIKVFGIVYCAYIVSAFIASFSFSSEEFFFVSDSSKYISKFSDYNAWTIDEAIFSMVRVYGIFDDSNGLFNECFGLWAHMANVYLGGTSVLYLTLFLTLFGFLTSLEVYKIFLYYFESSKASKYVCVFMLLSLFHIYSIVIIRDISISFFYLLGLRKVLGRPKISDIFILLFVMLVTIGIRLYTGLFFGTFIMFWLYKLLQDPQYSRYKFLLVPVIIVGISFVGAAFASSVLVKSAVDQVGYYDELYEEGGGTVARLKNLPIGLRQIVILLFSQLPLDNFQRLSMASSFSNYFLVLLSIVYQIFGFVIFYGLMYLGIINGYFKKMQFYDLCFLGIMLLYIAINMSTHIDMRRAMQAIPFVFIFYQLALKQVDRKKRYELNKIFIILGLFIMLAYGTVSSL